MQDFVTTQLVAAVRTPETIPFCIFFKIKNSELKENKKNLKKEEENIMGNNPFPFH